MTTPVKTWRVSERKLVRTDGVIKMRFDSGAEFEASLNEIPAILKKENLTEKMPRWVTINGMKGGAFPCVLARTDTAAWFLSSAAGYTVDTGDGLSFATQAAARRFARKAMCEGAKLEDIGFEWRVGSGVQKMVEETTPGINKEPAPAAEEESPFL